MKRALLVRPLLSVSPLVCALLLVHCRAESSREPPVRGSSDVALEGPRARGDLDEIRKRGVLRILVPSLTEEHLSRSGAPDAEDRAMAQAFAERLGVEAQFLVVARRSELFDLLEEGYGDIVTAQLTVTDERSKRFRFTRPTETVTEWLVGRKGAPSLPRRLEDLNGSEVHVRKSSAYVDTLKDIAASGVAVRIVFAPESLDSETLAYEVSRGLRPLTVLDSSLLATIESYNPDLEKLLPLLEGRELAWLVRNDAPDLAAAADAFIFEHYLTDHRAEDRSTGGLQTVRERGSLRVITLNDPVHYFLYRGRQMGFDYEVGRLAARRLGVRLEMVVPPRRDLVFDWLLDGRGDFIATTLTVTPERQDVLAFSRPYMFIEELVVRAANGSDKISSVSELRGRSIHAWRSSSHYETLVALSERYGPFEILPIPEDMEFDDILDRVADGSFEMAVLDSHILEAELPYRTEVEVAFPLVDPRIDEYAATVGVYARDKAVAFALGEPTATSSPSSTGSSPLRSARWSSTSFSSDTSKEIETCRAFAIGAPGFRAGCLPTTSCSRSTRGSTSSTGGSWWPRPIRRAASTPTRRAGRGPWGSFRSCRRRGWSSASSD